ncbi:MAG: glutamine-hydrolyzing GMP synthase, partial [Bifidobacteriaceae bacterium]|nr:glutamine-hydrolyzing GMP synthase [Bifidobacteriaceae bacterium]
MTSPLPNHKPVLVVDFGAQYAQLIARRVREAHVYSEIVPHTWTAERILERDPGAIILSGGPASVFEDGAPQLDPKLLDSGVPILGICYGFQAMAHVLGATVDQAFLGEYGSTQSEVQPLPGLLDSSPTAQTVWMSHGVAVTEAPEGFEVLASTPGAPVAAFQDRHRRLYGVQWHPEVRHTPLGQRLLENFLYLEAQLRPEWTAGSIVAEQVEAIR